MLGGRTWESFFRLFTAKEATLKANGKGIGYLRECNMRGHESAADRLALEHAGAVWHVFSGLGKACMRGH